MYLSLMPPLGEARSWWPTTQVVGSAFGLTFDEVWEAMPGEHELDTLLGDLGVGEPGLSLLQKQERYARFQGTTFGVAPRELWPELRRQLLPLERGLACSQESLGCASGFVFDPGIDPEARVMQRPTPLPPHQREWVRDELAK